MSLQLSLHISSNLAAFWHTRERIGSGFNWSSRQQQQQEECKTNITPKDLDKVSIDQYEAYTVVLCRINTSFESHSRDSSRIFYCARPCKYFRRRCKEAFQSDVKPHTWLGMWPTNVVFYVFNPALIYANLAQTLTLQSLVTLWFMPLNIFATFIIGSILGLIVIHVTRAPSHLRGLILGCSSAGNLGNMLLIILPAVCKGKGSPFGDQDVCYKYSMAYASLSMAIGAIYLWSYVYNIVRIYSSKNTKEAELNGFANGVTEETSSASLKSCDEGPVPSKECSLPEDDVDRFTLPYSRSNEKNEAPVSVKFLEQLKMFARKINLKRLLAPSTIGAILGFIVGVVAPFRRLMIGGSAPLHVIQDSASLLGDGAIPTVSLIMGGNLTKGLKASQIHMPIIVGILVVRYILSPLFGIFIVKGAIHFGLVHSDPLYKFTLLLQYAVPPAMNISTITQLFGAGENECSVIMLWAYALASISLTLWSMLFMWLVS